MYLLASFSYIYADDLYTEYVYIYSNCIRILMLKNILKGNKKYIKY